MSVLMALSLAGSALAQQDPLTVTSDTAEYCLGLADRMAAEGDMPPHVQALWERGRALCEHGHVQGGLLRLRRAMLMTRGAAE